MAHILDRVPDQTGRTFFITGGTRGLGLELVRGLTAKNANVVFAGRDEEAGASILDELRRRHPGSDVDFVRLDLQDPQSVTDAAAHVTRSGVLHVLINNAGIMAPPLHFSDGGYESQWATNVIGPFDLTAQLLPVILASPSSRVVNVTSLAHAYPGLTAEKARLEVQGAKYKPFRVYGHTKLANILVARELDRRLGVAGSSTIAVAAHPGVAGTDIAAAPFSWAGRRVQDAAVAAWNAVTRSAAEAAGPIFAAATAPGVEGGDVIGPRAVLQSLGAPARVHTSPASHDGELGREIVGWLEQVTGRSLDV